MYQFFCKVFSDKIFEHLVNETNRCADNFLATATLIPHSPYKKRFPTSLLEMKNFVGIKLFMGIIHKSTIKSNWSTDDYLCTFVFNALMDSNRFCNILRFWHFADSSVQDNTPLKKQNPFLKMLKDALSAKYTLSQKMTVDQSLLNYKGRLHFRQYIKSKRSRFE